ERLPSRVARPPGCRGCLPGSFPGPGPPSEFDSQARVDAQLVIWRGLPRGPARANGCRPAPRPRKTGGGTRAAKPAGRFDLARAASGAARGAGALAGAVSLAAVVVLFRRQDAGGSGPLAGVECHDAQGPADAWA